MDRKTVLSGVGVWGDQEGEAEGSTDERRCDGCAV